MYKWEIILFSEKKDIALNQIKVVIVPRKHKPDDVLRLWFRNGLGNNPRLGPFRLRLIMDGDHALSS